MKVLKFGGTSVGSVDSIRQIQHIIGQQTDDCIVVVSALGGITDQLLRAAHLALENGEEYMEVYQQIRQRHLDMIQTLIENATVRQMLCHEIERILDELRSKCQVTILSDTFYEFAMPLMKKLGFPMLMCNALEVSDEGKIIGYRLRCAQSKLTTVKALQSCGFETIAAGDSFNDLGMIRASKAGFLFRSTEKIKADNPDLPVIEDYGEFLKAIVAAL